MRLERCDVLKCVGAGAVAMLAPGWLRAAEVQPRRPNIIIMLADDLGFSDLGCYGGEIKTPNLDALAKNGLRMTQMYNSARCCPSRASLLTGQHPQSVGFPGMSGSLPRTCVTIPEVLRAAGYETLMAGKWHLGKPGPIERGFSEYYGMLGGYGSFWNKSLYSRLPAGRPDRDYAAGKFYATDAITDHALDFVAGTRKAGKPYFLYLAYNAPHFPLHAPKELVDKYVPVYEQGWDRIRDGRYARMRKMGLIDDKLVLSPRSVIPPNQVANMHGWSGKENPAWDTLPTERRADLARRMAVYAAMVDRMDQDIGRVVADLKSNGELDNTLIYFLSDNGACAEWDPFGFDVTANIGNVNLGTTSGNNILHTDAELASMGDAQDYCSYGSGWANACNTPLGLYKHYAHEGGISSPFIIHWPAGMRRKGAIDNRPGQILDIMTTCVEVAGAKYPEAVNDQTIMPTEGVSLCDAMRGDKVLERVLCFEHEGNRAVRSGSWKLVAVAGQAWELYDKGGFSLLANKS